MQIITIGTKNQVVIPKEIRKKIEGLKPGRKVSMYALNENTVAIKLEKISWLSSSFGVMKESMRDADQEVTQSRSEWDE